MSYTAFEALVRRDLRLFFQDKRAMTMSFVAPIAIASFFGYIFGGVADDKPPSKIAVAVVDRDQSEVSRKVIAALGADAALDVKSRSLEEARELVRGGKTTVAAVIPPGRRPDESGRGRHECRRHISLGTLCEVILA